MKVSVIIPIYNAEEAIEACLLSVIQQDYPHIEIVIVNDCTPDQSFDRAKAVISRHSWQDRVQYREHLQNRGPSAARNTGINSSTGEYLFFLDNDDTLADEAAISYLVDCALETKEPRDLVVGNFQKIAGNRVDFILASHQKSYDSNQDVFKDYAHSKLWVIGCAKLIKREFLIQNTLYFKEGIYHEDVLWAFHLYRVAVNIYSTPRIVYNHYVREGSITWQVKERNITDQMTVIMRMYQTYLHNPEYMPRETLLVIELYRKEVLDWLVSIGSEMVSKDLNVFILEQVQRLKTIKIPAKTGRSRFNKQNLWLRFPASWIVANIIKKRKTMGII